MAKKPKVELDNGTSDRTLVKGGKKTPKEEGDKPIKPVPTPNARKWRDNIQRSQKVRKSFLEDSERFWRMYQGDYNRNPKGGEFQTRKDFSVMSVNYVYAHIENVTPSVFTGFPFIKVRPKPKAGESIQHGEVRARNMELVLNYWFKELGLDEELKDVFLDTFFGPATVELGWETEVEEKAPEQEMPDGLSETGAPDVVTLKDRPFIIRREFKSMYFDPDARRRKDCNWFGVEEIILWNDFIASPKYTDKAKKTLKPIYYPVENEERNWMGRDQDQSNKEWIKLTTIWDKVNRQIFVVADNYENFVNSDTAEGVPWPYEIDYKSDPFPFCIHDAKKDMKCAYTWSEIKAGEPQIVEMNRIRSAIQTHVKRTLPKYVYAPAAGTRSQISKLMMARSDEAVELANPDAFKALENAPIPPPLFEFNGMSRDDYTTVMGTAEYSNQSLADTATEAQIMEGRSQARKSLRSRQWEQFVVEIAGKLSQLCQQNMDEQLAIEIAGPNGIEWLNVTKEEIQGEFYFDIEPGVMEYKNEAIRRSQLLRFMELTQNDPNSNRRYLIGKLAKELDLDPTEAIVAEDQMPKPPAPEPNVKFKDIDPALLTNPVLMNSLVIAAMSQNQVQIDPALAAQAQGLPPPPPPMPPGGAPGAQGGGIMPQGSGPALGGKDISQNGMSPNGREDMAPVQGNLMGKEDFLG